MGVFEVQGIVSAATGDPLVQMRQLDEEGKEEFKFSVSSMEAREIATNIQEAAANAIYEAALIAWAKDELTEEKGILLIDAIRRYRTDHWGFPNMPEDWRTDG